MWSTVMRWIIIIIKFHWLIIIWNFFSPEICWRRIENLVFSCKRTWRRNFWGMERKIPCSCVSWEKTKSNWSTFFALSVFSILPSNVTKNFNHVFVLLVCSWVFKYFDIAVIFIDFYTKHIKAVPFRIICF